MQSHRSHLIFMAIADHGEHVRQGRNFLRRSLRIAASDYDAGLWIGALGATNVGARIAVRLCGHGASIDHDDIGPRQTIGWERAHPFEGRRDGISIRLAGATTKVFYVIFCHFASVTMVVDELATTNRALIACFFQSTLSVRLDYIDTQHGRERQ